MHTNTIEDRASLSLSRMLVLVAALLFAVMVAPHVAWAATETVDYQKATVNADKSVSYSTVANQECTIISESGTTWGEAGKVSSYVASSSVSVSGRITVNGTVDLILADGATLNASQGITVGTGNTLNIYAQSEGTGKLTADASATVYRAGIGGSGNSADGNVVAGTINIHGGKVTAAGGGAAAGIGGGYLGDNASSAGGAVTIYGGTIQATGGENAAGIGGGESGAGGTLVIYDGTVTATGGQYGAGIGGGNDASGGSVTMSGGKVSATGGQYGAGIGSGSYRHADDLDGGTVDISGGTVSATGGNNAAGIGGGADVFGAKVSITGGTVLATGGTGAQGIGCQDRLSGTGTLTLGKGVTLYCSAKSLNASDAKTYVTGDTITRERYMWTSYTAPTGPAKMYRLYNPNSGEHFYTASAGERDLLINEGWSYEGEAWVAPESSASPVYRLYNSNGGDHHYTMSSGERGLLIIAGWTYEGIGWYSDDDKTVPVWRQYNPNAKSGAHNFTTSAGERDLLVKEGWNDEGIAWYGLKQ